MKRVAIVQSNYIPWRGYFDLISLVDEFVLYDDRQYTRRDWRNRNRVKTAQGTVWLSVPVLAKGRYHQRIDETVVSDPGWAATHWKTLTHAYAAAAGFDAYRDVFARAYEELADEPRLSLINRRLIETVCAALGITTRLSWSTDYDVTGDRNERLRNLCVAAGADEYLSGPSARDYLDESIFAEAGISVVWMDYSGYPEYPQLHPPFDPAVTVLDLIFNVGERAPEYMKLARTRGARSSPAGAGRVPDEEQLRRLRPDHGVVGELPLDH